MSGILFRAENISLQRNNKLILDAVNWEICRGQHWALLGLNGSGKSTLLRVMLGYQAPLFGGKLSYFGSGSGENDYREVRKRIGYLSSEFQAGTLGWVTGREIVASGFFGSNGLYEELSPIQKEKAREVAALFELQDLLEKPSEEMSYGELRRCLFARALVSSPPLLILDEPFNGVDIPSREKLLRMLDGVNADETSLLIVTHHPEEIPVCATHAAFIVDGRIFAKGKKEEVLTEKLTSAALKCKLRVNSENGRTWIRALDPS
ncbi:MAG: ATP-binding cassette domain-containing protein [Spirochaetia bacterium]|nr:ATP-binding cassette domain-containing protein [Spirochaetia bacterium]